MTEVNGRRYVDEVIERIIVVEPVEKWGHGTGSEAEVEGRDFRPYRVGGWVGVWFLWAAGVGWWLR